MNQSISKATKCAGLCLILMIGSSIAARADVITFNGFTGPDGTIVTSYTEGNFVVVPESGTWREALSVGAPGPSFFTLPNGSQFVSIARSDGGLFRFSDFELGSASYASAAVFASRRGYGVFQFGNTSVLPRGQFNDLVNPFPNINVDLIEIAVGENGGTGLFIDNIVTTQTPVPEPASLTLLGVGLMGFGLKLRRRISKGTQGTPVV